MPLPSHFPKISTFVKVTCHLAGWLIGPQNLELEHHQQFKPACYNFNLDTSLVRKAALNPLIPKTHT